MDENIARFIKSQDKARKLIQMDSNRTLDKLALNAKNNGKIDINE
jgi:hypothetical protein